MASRMHCLEPLRRECDRWQQKEQEVRHERNGLQDKLDARDNTIRRREAEGDPVQQVARWSVTVRTVDQSPCSEAWS